MWEVKLITVVLILENQCFTVICDAYRKGELIIYFGLIIYNKS